MRELEEHCRSPDFSLIEDLWQGLKIAPQQRCHPSGLTKSSSSSAEKKKTGRKYQDQRPKSESRRISDDKNIPSFRIKVRFLPVSFKDLNLNIGLKKRVKIWFKNTHLSDLSLDENLAK